MDRKNENTGNNPKNPFKDAKENNSDEMVKQNASDSTKTDDAALEQQRKEALTERD